MEHQPFSPDLAENNFSLFPKIKSALKGQEFQYIEDIKKICDNGTESYSTAGFPKNVSNSDSIAAQGEFFEGDASLYAISVQVYLQKKKSFLELHSHTSYSLLLLLLKVNVKLSLCFN
jgi:hypothetical protein